ncbi:MAG: Mov34/MPN/PAD-1 family protein [Candidatus Heimdallarchaeota archaeon]
MIILPEPVYAKFLRFALENANPYDRPRQWKECIGLILGRIENSMIFVTDIIPMNAGNAVYVDINDYEKVFSLVPFSKIEAGEVVVGWAHTHPGLGLFFSGTDIRTQYAYQQMHPLAFGLVLDPMKVTSNFAGFRIYRVDSSGSRAIEVEYNFEVDFDFTTTRTQLITELYQVPPIPTTPIVHSNTEIEWRDMRIRIDGPVLGYVNKDFTVNMEIGLRKSQYLRLEYQISMTNLISSLKLPSEQTMKIMYHEAIKSGNLAVFSMYSKNPGRAYLKIEKLKVMDGRRHSQEMPNLTLVLDIQDE